MSGASWTGSLSSPFRFSEVGRLDPEAAYIGEHAGRLLVSTWPLNYGSLMGLMGYRSEATAGIWMSPPVGRRPLYRTDAKRWTRIWGIEEYEPDTVVALS